MVRGQSLVSLVTLIAFWRKKEPPPDKGQRIIPLPELSAPPLEPQEAAISLDDVNRARGALKVLKLERQILGSAVTTIYESHSKGDISEVERDRMLERYKVDLKRLEAEIGENQRIVDLHDLEGEREEVMKEFNSKLATIDSRLKSLKSGGSQPPTPNRQNKSPPNDPVPGDGIKTQDGAQSTNKSAQEISDSEKRIVQIREEILKAMDRLEQIETEG